MVLLKPRVPSFALQVIKAHGVGNKAPSIHDGTPVLQGARGICLRNANTELLTGGSDGKIIVWDISSGQPDKQLKTIEVRAD